MRPQSGANRMEANETQADKATDEQHSEIIDAGDEGEIIEEGSA